MKYLGSKASHADEILKVVLAKRRNGQTYVEPFVGGANVMVRVPQKDGPRIGADINKYMIALHVALARGWKPPRDISEIDYWAMAKEPTNYAPELVAFIARGCSFGALWFNTFAKGQANDGTWRNYCRESADQCVQESPFLKGAKFIHSSYNQLNIPSHSLIYCDPPYVNTVGYEGSAQTIAIGESAEKNVWRAYKFWRWADQKVDEGHTVFVSEYAGPTADAFPPVISQKAKDEVTRLAAQARAKQQDLKCPGSEVQAAVDAWIAAKAHAESTATSAKDRWKVVWEKEVSVNINAVGIDVEARDGLKRDLVQVEFDLEAFGNATIDRGPFGAGETMVADHRTRPDLESDVAKLKARAAELRRMIAATSAERRVERLFHREA